MILLTMKTIEDSIRSEDVNAFSEALVKLMGGDNQRATEFLSKSISLLQSQTKVESPQTIKREDSGYESENYSLVDRKSNPQLNTCINFEVLDTVFTFLDYQALCKASEVCKSWRNLALDPSFWAVLGPVTNDSMEIPPLSSQAPGAWDLRTILRLPRFNLLHSMDLGPWRDEVDDEWIVSNLAHLKQLRTLSLFDCRKVLFAHSNLTQLTNLTAIDLGASQIGHQISNDSLAILRHLTNLRKINLHYCEKINDYGLHHVASLPKLKYLDMGNCYRLTSYGISMLTPLASTLTFLSLKSPVRSNFSISDEGISHLSGFSKLTSLDIGYCKRITDKGIACISKLKSITHIGLASTSITDAGLVSLKTLVNAQHIDIANCILLTTASALITTHNFRYLKSLNFRGVPFGGQDPAYLLSGLRECYFLENLDLSNTYIGDGILTESNCKTAMSVKTLNVSYCSALTDLSVHNVCAFMPRLHNLIVSHCHRLTDKSLEHMEMAKELHYAGLEGVYSFTEEGIAKLRRCFPYLTIVR